METIMFLVFGCVSRPFGCEIAGTQAVVKIFITIIPANVPLLEPDLHSEFIFQPLMMTPKNTLYFSARKYSTTKYGPNSTCSLVRRKW